MQGRQGIDQRLLCTSLVQASSRSRQPRQRHWPDAPQAMGALVRLLMQLILQHARMQPQPDVKALRYCCALKSGAVDLQCCIIVALLLAPTQYVHPPCLPRVSELVPLPLPNSCQHPGPAARWCDC